MRLLVTGGCGFIGSNFIRFLLHKYPDYEIINLDKLTYAGNINNLKDLESNRNYNFYNGDICDKDLVNSLVSNCDIIVNFAAESHVDRSIDSSYDFIKTNIVGTHILLEAARLNNRKRFHHISTDEVYGSLEESGFFDEETNYKPHSPYSASKASADHLVMAYYHTYNLPVTITNCSNNYGPYQHPEKLIPLFITNLIQSKKVPVYGNGKNVRDWLFVEDHCIAIDLVINKGIIGETYCIGGDCEKTNLEITSFLLDYFNFGDEMIDYVDDRKGHDYRYAIDFSKISENLGWSPKYNFSEAMVQTIKWYQSHVDWWSPLKK